MLFPVLFLSLASTLLERQPSPLVLLKMRFLQGFKNLLWFSVARSSSLETWCASYGYDGTKTDSETTVSEFETTVSDSETAVSNSETAVSNSETAV